MIVVRGALLGTLLALAVSPSLSLAAAEDERAGGLSTGTPRSALLAPLAVRSLLLDGARVGARTVAVGERGHVLLSDDDGKTWRQVVVPTVATLTAVTFAGTRDGWAVGHDAVILHTADAGETWELQHEEVSRESPFLDVFALDAQRVIAIGAYGLCKVTGDGGATWSERSISDRDAHYNAISAGPNGRLYIVGESGTVLTSSDAGSTWQALPSPDVASLFGGVALPDGDLVVFGLRGHAFRYLARTKEWRALATGMESSLMTGLLLEDGGVLLAGADGALLHGDASLAGLELARRPDRGTISSVVPGASGHWILLGTFGAAVLEASGLP